MVKLKSLLQESITINSVKLSPKNPSTGGPIVATYNGVEYTYRVTVDTIFYKGKVGVVAIWKSSDSAGTYYLKDNTNKKFPLKRTNLQDIVDQVRQKNNKIMVSVSGADITLTKIA
jgi:hypothetical protein